MGKQKMYKTANKEIVDALRNIVDGMEMNEAIRKETVDELRNVVDKMEKENTCEVYDMFKNMSPEDESAALSFLHSNHLYTPDIIASSKYLIRTLNKFRASKPKPIMDDDVTYVISHHIRLLMHYMTRKTFELLDELHGKRDISIKSTNYSAGLYISSGHRFFGDIINEADKLVRLIPAK
jgi:hypothetical protein